MTPEVVTARLPGCVCVCARGPAPDGSRKRGSALRDFPTDSARDRRSPPSYTQRSSMTLGLAALPDDALDAVASLLTGLDLLHLSHVNAQCWAYFSRPQVWTTLLPRTQEIASCPKQTYAQARSVLFTGLRVDERLAQCGGSDASSCAIVKSPDSRVAFTEQFSDSSVSFAFDTWFSLLDGEKDGVLTGGVLLGAQSLVMRTCTWTNHHVAFMAVDTARSLYCSVLDDDANCVATDLKTERWYHIALSYDRGQQHVFLDGELVAARRGQLHRKWRELTQTQVGTGFVSSFWRQMCGHQLDRLPSRDLRTFCGWHGFHGVVDDFCVWDGALSSSEVELLARCDASTLAREAWYSLKRDANQVQTPATAELRLVRCTRPLECIMKLHFLRGSQAERNGSPVADYWNSLCSCLGWLPSHIPASLLPIKVDQ